MGRIRFACAAGLGAAWALAWAMPEAGACTAFLYSDPGSGVVVGKSFDFTWGRGFLTKNPRGLVKTAVWKPGETAARWRARYGSLTFNQIARGMPQGGINERGLVVEALELPGAVYPPRDARPVVNELQWVQYQLDLYATTREVLAHLDEVRLNRLAVGMHYLVCDRGGACAAVEPLAGGLRARAGRTLPVAVLANEAYDVSLAASERGGHADALPGGELSSSARFAQVRAAMREVPGRQSPVSSAFGFLENVRSTRSPWTIVYDLTHGSIYFRSLDAPAVKRVRVADFDYACRAGSARRDVNAAGSGDVTRQFGGAGYADPGTAERTAWSAITHAPAYLIEGVLGVAHGETCAP